MNNADEEFVSTKIAGIHIYSCYPPPSKTYDEFKSFLHRLVTDAKDYSRLVIAGDFNAWATEWGSTETDSRGLEKMKAIPVLDVMLVYSGNSLTFRRVGTGSIIDLAFITIEWRVGGHYTHSNHQAILWEVPVHKRRTVKRSSRQWAGRSANSMKELLCLTCITLRDQTTAWRQ